MNKNTFINNTITGTNSAGGAISAVESNSSINNSEFANNTITAYSGLGGAIFGHSSIIRLNNSTFTSNTVILDFTKYKIIQETVIDFSALFGFDPKPETAFINNNAMGGALSILDTNLTIESNTFTSNMVTATEDAIGNAATSSYRNINLNTGQVANNNETDRYFSIGSGGALSARKSKVKLIDSRFTNNIVSLRVYEYGYGGAVYANTHSILAISRSTFTSNVANRGGALFLSRVVVNTEGFLDVKNNVGPGTGALRAHHSTLHFSGHTTFSNNNGTLNVFACNITFSDHTNINNNSEYGGITIVQSDVIFNGIANLENNTATYGGAISATQSKLYIFANITIAHNKAYFGGGIYAYQSEFYFMRNINIGENNAGDKGGGIHFISSIMRITDQSQTFVFGNYAKRGGGAYLKLNSKLYILKANPEDTNNSVILNTSWLRLDFSKNTADYGGAVYIDDYTDSNTCYAKPFSVVSNTILSTECFIQGLTLWLTSYSLLNIQNTYFTNNSARVAGDIIYGGLLDRCTVNYAAEIFEKYPMTYIQPICSVSYILNITNLNITDFTNSTKSISSDPVRVCFCTDNQPDCSYQLGPKYVRKGETITVPIVAVDQVNNTISSSTIYGSVPQEAKLGEGQSAQQTNDNGTCTELEYTILSPRNYEYLFLYADGPCMDIGISKANLTVYIEPCPVGFTDTNLRCECDAILYDVYIHNCSIDNQTVLRKGNVWFAYINATDHPQSYVLHKHCPFDYCCPPTESVHINLNKPDGTGADAMCAFNRTKILCGTCKDGLSLSFGSSHCRKCSNNWIALLSVFIIAGIALVAFLLVCNLTVAVGTINGLIFYANIIAANNVIFLPFDKTNVLTIFIAWLNLDLGFETCFYDGMDAYAKTWLQLAFPIYVLSLVIAIIVISDYSFKFAVLFTKGKDPIATLATLILLSYTKLLRTIIASLSFTTLEYSDGSHELVWLTDANVLYLKGKHIPLFITAIAIVLVGTTFTLVLFGWQWLVRCPNVTPFTWITKNTKFISFMDVYHNPYNKNHRYWIGLLLLVRCLLYLVSAVNVLGDPRINLLSIIIIVVVLFFFQVTLLQNYKIHKSTLIHILENISILNVMVFTSVTFYITDDCKSQALVAYVSTGTAFATFLGILIYHACLFVIRKLFERVKTLQFTRHHPPENQITLHTSDDESIALNDEEEMVNVTEINALPEPVDSDEEQYDSEGSSFDEDVTANVEHYADFIKLENEDFSSSTGYYSQSQNSTNLKSGNFSIHEELTLRSLKTDTKVPKPSLPIINIDSEENEDEMFWGDESTPLLENDA